MNEGIVLFGQEVDIITLLLGVWIVGYGVAFGVKNHFLKFIYLFMNTSSNQSTAGKLCDGFWLTTIIILIGLHY